MSRSRAIFYFIVAIVCVGIGIAFGETLKTYEVVIDYLPSDWTVDARTFFFGAAILMAIFGVVTLLMSGRASSQSASLTGFLDDQQGSSRASTKSPVTQAPAKTPAQKWAIAAAGNLIQLNGDNFTLLNSSVGDSVALLSEWWGVNNSQELLETLAWLERDGHRTEFKALYERTRGMSRDEFNSFVQSLPADKRGRAQFVWEHGKDVTNGDLIAWDLGRLINVCRFGYSAGYISEEAAWAKIFSAAREIQKTYRSWDEMSRNYQLGWQFWRGGQALPSQDRKTSEWLLTNPASPWRQLAWETPLS